jgi:hypothetical protein
MNNTNNDNNRNNDNDRNNDNTNSNNITNNISVTIIYNSPDKSTNRADGNVAELE